VARAVKYNTLEPILSKIGANMLSKIPSSCFNTFILSSALFLSACNPTPVETPPNPTRITEINIAPVSPATLNFGDRIDVSFKYISNLSKPLTIFVFPYTNGKRTPNWGNSGSPIAGYPVPSGSGSTFVTVSKDASVVDQLHFEIYDAYDGNLVYSENKAVNYTFKAP
jgi:hypothetical protein